MKMKDEKRNRAQEMKLNIPPAPTVNKIINNGEQWGRKFRNYKQKLQHSRSIAAMSGCEVRQRAGGCGSQRPTSCGFLDPLAPCAREIFRWHPPPSIFSAPEVLAGEIPSEKHDVWGAGLCLYFMLIGRTGGMLCLEVFVILDGLVSIDG